MRSARGVQRDAPARCAVVLREPWRSGERRRRVLRAAGVLCAGGRGWTWRFIQECRHRPVRATLHLRCADRDRRQLQPDVPHVLCGEPVWRGRRPEVHAVRRGARARRGRGGAQGADRHPPALGRRADHPPGIRAHPALGSGASPDRLRAGEHQRGARGRRRAIPRDAGGRASCAPEVRALRAVRRCAGGRPARTAWCRPARHAREGDRRRGSAGRADDACHGDRPANGGWRWRHAALGGGEAARAWHQPAAGVHERTRGDGGEPDVAGVSGGGGWCDGGYVDWHDRCNSCAGHHRADDGCLRRDPRVRHAGAGAAVRCRLHSPPLR